ncbi:MAG: S8 family peptidase, partial [Candidatus Hodarchaeales archaeon]
MNNILLTNIRLNSHNFKALIKNSLILLICFSFLAGSNLNLPVNEKNSTENALDETQTKEIIDNQPLIETKDENLEEIINSNLNIPESLNTNQKSLDFNNPLENWGQSEKSIDKNNNQMSSIGNNNINSFDDEEIVTWGEVSEEIGIQELINLIGKTPTYSDTQTKIINDTIDIVIGLKPGSSFDEDYYQSILTTSTIKQSIEQLNSIVVNVPLSSLESFYSDWGLLNEVRYIEPSVLYSIDFIPNDPSWSLQWGNQRIQTDLAWDIEPGNFSEVLVAVIDTGIDYNHPDLSTQYVPLGFDWVNNDTDPMDDHFHGTHVAGIVAGTINNSIGIAGTANVRIMAEKFLNSGGSGTSEDGASAIIHAVDQGADILSNSWSGTAFSSLIKDAVVYAEANDVVVIAAAGNSGNTGLHYPAAYPEVISVSATDVGDNLASFSNHGETIEIAAPGVNIYSTMPSNSYDYKDGTSMATPYVSGVAALILSQFPDWTAQQVRLHLQETAEDLGDQGRDDLFGYGLVNAFDAVQPPPEHNLKVYLSPPNGLLPNSSTLINVTVYNAGLVNESNVLTELWINNSLVDSTVFSEIS